MAVLSMSLVSFVQGTNFVWEEGEKQAVASNSEFITTFQESQQQCI